LAILFLIELLASTGGVGLAGLEDLAGFAGPACFVFAGITDFGFYNIEQPRYN
jgi:hypothetical protein